MTETRFYRNAHDGYVAISNETAMGGTVYAGKGPMLHGGIESIQEQAYYVGQISQWQAVEPTEVPDEWMTALGYEKPVKRAPKPVYVPPEPIEIDVTWWPFTGVRRPWTELEKVWILGGIILMGAYCLLFGG